MAESKGTMPPLDGTSSERSMDETPDTGDLKIRLYAEQVGQIEKVASFGLVATLVNASVLTAVFWDVTSHFSLITWYFILSLVTVLRHPRLYQHIPVLADRSNTTAKGRFLIGGVALSGIIWGASALALFPQHSVPHQVFLAFILGGMVAGAVGAFSIMMPVFLSFSLPALAPLIIRFFSIHDEFHTAMGGMVLLFALLMWGTARRYHATAINNIILRFKNSDLIAVLSSANERAERFNKELETEIQVRKEAEREVQQHKEHLADLVEERTAELKEANRRLCDEFGRRERLEEELFKKAKMESLGTLAGGIAHDFNNLLTGIQGHISILSLDLPRGSPQEKTLIEADKACLRARDLANQLITFAKGGEPIKTCLTIGKVIKESANFVLSGSNVRCDYSLPDDLWPLEADAGQIGQAIQNLVINADQAMPEGGIIEISAENKKLAAEEIATLPAGSYVLITIRDHGSGINYEHFSRIFDPYFTTKANGNGLGLTATYSIIQRHNGHILVSSQPKEGTTFRIYLPAAVKEDSTVP